MLTPSNEYNTPGTLSIDGVRGQNLASVYNLGKIKREQKFCKRFGIQFSTFPRLLEAFGRHEPIALGSSTWNGTGFHWYGFMENRFERLVGIDSITGGVNAPGATIQVQLAATAVDGNGAFFGRAGEYFTMPITYNQARIDSIAQTNPGQAGNVVTFTLIPNSTTVNLTTDITNALNAGFSNFSITTNAWASGTKQPDSTVVGWTTVGFYTQILKESATAEGQEVAREYYPAFNNGKQSGVFNYDTAIAEWRLMKRVTGSWLLGQTTTNTVTQTTSKGYVNQVYTTEGLKPNIATYGNNYPSPQGSWNVDDLFNIKDFMIREGVTSNMAIMLTGSRKDNEAAQNMKAFLMNNGETYTSATQSYFNYAPQSSYANKDGMERALAMGIKEYDLSGFTFMKNIVWEFSDPQGMGAPGYDLDLDTIILPLQTIADKDGKAQFNISSRYVSLGNYSRDWEFFNISGAGGNRPYVIEDDLTNAYIRSHRGFQILGSNNMTWMYH
jgi:hypothetical protein